MSPKPPRRDSKCHPLPVAECCIPTMSFSLARKGDSMPSSSARRSRQSGSILMLMTFMLPFLVIPLVGLAIDASVCRLVELRLQAAVDGAATGSGRLLGVVTDNVVQNVASEFLKSNFTTGGGSWGAYNLSSVQGTDIVYTPGITKKIFVKARVTALFANALCRSRRWLWRRTPADWSARRSRDRFRHPTPRCGAAVQDSRFEL